AAAPCEIDADAKRAGEREYAEPERDDRDGREIGRVEDSIRAHAGVEIFIEGLDADDGEHDACEPVPEDRAVELAFDRVRPRSAKQIRKQAGIQKESVAYQREHAEQPPRRRSFAASARE